MLAPVLVLVFVVVEPMRNTQADVNI